MTANDTTPPEGKDSIDRWRSGEEPFPLLDETEGDLAFILEAWKHETEEAVDDVATALLEDSEKLTDEKLMRMMGCVEALEALFGTLAHFVPEEERNRSIEE